MMGCFASRSGTTGGFTRRYKTTVYFGKRYETMGDSVKARCRMARVFDRKYKMADSGRKRRPATMEGSGRMYKTEDFKKNHEMTVDFNTT